MIEARTKDAFKLLMKGEETLSKITNNGIKIDKEYFLNQMPVIKDECKKLETEFLTTTELGAAWTAMQGHNVDIDSPDQMKAVLQKTGFDKFRVTEKGNLSVDKTVIEKLPYESSRLISRRNQLKTLWQNLMLKTIVECDQYGFIHPNFNLHTARTYRSSCDGPNLQNQPKHNEMQKTLVRSGFIPREPHRALMELDLRANEVSCGCSIHHDANMLRFLSDPDADMHSEVAHHYWMVDEATYVKDLRKAVKGPFVFAGFYGAGADSMARNLWEWALEKNPPLKNNVKLLDFLKSKGIGNFDEMLIHTQKEYDWFWFDLFKNYGNWKEEQWKLYQKQGFLDYPTGFRVTEVMTKTQAINTVIQGSAFHVLLAQVVEMQAKLERYNMKSCIIGQIHDSALLDIDPAEYNDVCDMYIESQELVRKMWPWIVYPIAIEADLGAPGASWADVKEMGVITHRKRAA